MPLVVDCLLPRSSLLHMPRHWCHRSLYGKSFGYAQRDGAEFATGRRQVRGICAQLRGFQCILLYGWGFFSMSSSSPGATTFEI